MEDSKADRAAAVAEAESKAALPAAGTVARLGMWNLYTYLQGSVEEIAAAVSERRIDILAVAESDNRPAEAWDGGAKPGLRTTRLAEKLCMHLAHTPGEPDIVYGVGILSKFPIKRQEWHLLKGDSDFVEDRYLVVADIEAPWGVITVCATHLDHLQEKSRVAQWDRIQSLIGDKPHVILGDFNAVYRADYSAAEWSANNRRRNAAGFADASPELMHSVFRGQQYIDAAAWCHANLHLKATSAYSTRVDYILASRNSGVTFIGESYEATWPRVPEKTDPLSDHALVQVDARWP